MPLIKKPIAQSTFKKPAPAVRASVIPATLRGLCVPIDSVKEWKDNPRKNDAAAQKLAELIRANGFRKPIVIDQNGIVRAGNTALKAMKILGELEIPVVKHDFKSEAAAVAFGISDNKASEFAEWDDGVLMGLMAAENMPEFVTATGFTTRELDLLGIATGADDLEEVSKIWHTIKILIPTDIDPETIKTEITSTIDRLGLTKKVRVK